MYLTKEQIRKVNDIKTRDVYVPAWGGTVKIRTITASERDTFEQQMYAGRTQDEVRQNVRATLVAMAVVGGDGALMFTADDIKMLGAKSAEAMDTIFAAIQQLNGMTDEDVEAATENLSEAPGDNDAGE